jgi:hypothetical protein
MSETKAISISWAIFALKDVIGREHIRNNIITAFVPNIQNAKHMKTFDAFQQYNHAPYDNKKNKILKYCEKIMTLPNKVAFTASNIQQHENDMETHYQCFIVDNEKKKLFAIDPAITKTGNGIYEPIVTYEIIQPFFETHGYDFQFIELSNPAQTTTEDVFCQSWSLHILLYILCNGIHCVDIPKLQLDKYAMLLDFYKQIVVFDEVANELNETFVQYVSDKKNKKNILASGGNFDRILQMNAADIILNMNPIDMQE